MVRRFFGGLALAVAAGLIGAALLHLIIILSLPRFSDRDAYTRVLAEGEQMRFHPIGPAPDARPAGPGRLRQEDPFLPLAVCAFDLSEAPVRLTAAGAGVPFWSLAVYDGQSDEVFSINDRTASNGGLDVIVATPAQTARIRKDMPDVAAQSIVVEATALQGYAVLRTLVPQASFAERAAQFLDAAACAPFE